MWKPQEFKDQKVVLVAVPGAFTRTCSEKHIPTFVQQRQALKAKGIDKIVVIAYNGKSESHSFQIETERWDKIADCDQCITCRSDGHVCMGKGQWRHGRLHGKLLGSFKLSPLFFSSFPSLATTPSASSLVSCRGS